MLLQRRAFLKMFVAATAAIVTDPKVLIAETSAKSTALVPALQPVDIICDITITPLRDETEVHALAQMMAEFARHMSFATGIPEKMLFGIGGSPTAAHYYAHLAEQHRRWNAEAQKRIIDTILDMEVMPYDVHILPS